MILLHVGLLIVPTICVHCLYYLFCFLFQPMGPPPPYSSHASAAGKPHPGHGRGQRGKGQGKKGKGKDVQV